MVWEFKNWYKNNKEEFNKKRRERYKNNKKYREDNKKRASEYYRKKVNKPVAKYKYIVIDDDGVEYYTIKKAAIAINMSTSTVRKYHKEGIIPNPTYTNENNWKLYSKKQIVALYLAFKDFKEKKIKSIYDIYDRLLKHWNK